MIDDEKEIPAVAENGNGQDESGQEKKTDIKKPEKKKGKKTDRPLTPEEEIDLARRRWKGAVQRLERHENKLEHYKDVIYHREVGKIINGNRVLVKLAEAEVSEYRSKKLSEENDIVKAKKDRDQHKAKYEELKESKDDGLKKTLQAARATEHARRMGPSTADKVLTAIRSHKQFPDLEKLAGWKKRNEFRTLMMSMLGRTSDLKEELEKKPKLFTRVVEILEEELKPEAPIKNRKKAGGR